MSDAINDNGSPPPVAAPYPPEPYGRAALLLVECLIHGLVARAGLSTVEAIGIIQSAIDVQNDISDDRGEDPNVVSLSAQLLTAMIESLRIDAPRE